MLPEVLCLQNVLFSYLLLCYVCYKAVSHITFDKCWTNEVIIRIFFCKEIK